MVLVIVTDIDVDIIIAINAKFDRSVLSRVGVLVAAAGVVSKNRCQEPTSLLRYKPTCGIEILVLVEPKKYCWERIIFVQPACVHGTRNTIMHTT